MEFSVALWTLTYFRTAWLDRILLLTMRWAGPSAAALVLVILILITHALLVERRITQAAKLRAQSWKNRSGTGARTHTQGMLSPNPQSHSSTTSDMSTTPTKSRGGIAGNSRI